MNIRHRCYLSYDHRDESRATAFMEEFDPRGESIINRTETIPEYVMNAGDSAVFAQKMRQFFLGDATVTIVLVGERTWEQRGVDAELRASLYRGPGQPANGLLAVRLLHHSATLKLPRRLRDNLDSGYGRFVLYPDTITQLAAWVDEAFRNRTQRLQLLKSGTNAVETKA